jgi:hypothetical protein
MALRRAERTTLALERGGVGMSSAGVLLIVAGVWLVAQVLGGGLAELVIGGG